MAGRRSTDSNASQPAMKVVGFHVEGVPPSPAQATLLQDALTEGGGSPDPVIIPPSFQKAGAPDSPERTTTLPSFIPGDVEDSPGIRDMLSGRKGVSPHALAQPELSKISTSHRGLAHTSSLPPMTGDAAADWKRFASSVARPSPPQASPQSVVRETKSQPPSTAVTPPISPYRPDERQLSSSYRQSAFELVQQMPQPSVDGHLPTSVADGAARIPERVRPIQAHMAGAFSDGSKMPQHPHPETSRHELGTPRQQHGFQVPAGKLAPLDTPPASRPAGPFASNASGQPAASSSQGDSAHGAAQQQDHAPAAASTPGSSPKKRRVPDLPSVPEVLSTMAIARGPSGDAGAGSQPSGAKQSTAAEPPVNGRQDTGKEKDGKAEGGKPLQVVKEGDDKKKATTKAERRAIQERQRAEKAAAKEAEPGKKAPPPAGKQASSVAPRGDRADGGAAIRNAPQGRETPPAAAPHTARTLQKVKSKDGPCRGQASEIFAHLPQHRAITIGNVFQESAIAAKVHPAVLQLGLQYADGSITGSNARCLAMLLTFKAVIQDYHTPASKELSRDLTSQLNLCIQFLVECRPLSVSMGTAIKNLKLKVSHISASTPQEDAKLLLLDEIDTFIQEKITYADEQVARTAQTKVEGGDVILTFAFSSAVLNTLLAAKKEGKRFRAMVADSRPHYEGRAMLAKLLANGIPCTYLQLNALSYAMQEATKVFMGASGAMSNGTIIARAGSASVAMVADAMQRPVIICCETLKFVDRVQLDSITYNELGSPDSLAIVDGHPELTDLQGWQDQPQLELLNLMYDAMPCDYVTLIITEVGAIPPTSIPVVLREYRTEPKM